MPQGVDISAGLVPAQPQAIDLSAGLTESPNVGTPTTQGPIDITNSPTNPNNPINKVHTLEEYARASPNEVTGVPETTEQAESDVNTTGTALGIAEGAVNAPSLIRSAAKLIPSTERAGQAFSELEKTIGNHPVGISSNLSKAVNELWAARETTNTNIPQTVRKLIDRIDPFTGGGELTYKEARAFSSEIGNLAAADKTAMTANTARLVGNLDKALTESIQETADLAGEGQKLGSAMKEYYRAMSIRRLSDSAKKWAFRAALGAGGYKIFKELFD